MRQALGESDSYGCFEKGDETERGYPESWLREVIRARPNQFLLDQPQSAEHELPY